MRLLAKQKFEFSKWIYSFETIRFSLICKYANEDTFQWHKPHPTVKVESCQAFSKKKQRRRLFGTEELYSDINIKWAYHHLVILQGQEVMDICFLNRENYSYGVYLIQNVSRKNMYLDTENALSGDNFKKFKTGALIQNDLGFSFWFCSYT